MIVRVSTAQWSFAANGTALFITARQPAGASGLSIPTNGILGVPADGSMTKKIFIRLKNANPALPGSLAIATSLFLSVKVTTTK